MKQDAIKEKPWLQFWPKHLPTELVIPQTPLFEYVETSAKRYSDKTALIFYGTKISYEDLWKSILKFAGYITSLGVKKRDRVSVYVENSPQFVITYYGTMRANAVVVPINPMLKGEELKYILNDSGSRVIVTTPDHLPLLKDVINDTSVEKLIVGRYNDYISDKPEIPVPSALQKEAEIPSDVIKWKDIMDKGSMPGEVEVGADDLAVLPYTSGTTGVPKGCMHTHFTVYSNTVGSYHWLSNTSSSVHLCTVPIFHVTGMIHPLNAALYAGGTIVMLTRWDRETAVQAIEKYKVTHWVNIATMVIDILSMPGIEKRDVSSILFIGGGGAPLPAAIGEKLDKLMGLKYVEGYGLTETISQTHFNPPDRPKMQCIGIPSFGVEAKIIDPDTGEELPPNKTGELLVSGPEVCKGYWNKPEEDATLFREINGERYLRTGDLCYMDDEGYFFVVDRVKRMINRAGFKVWPAAVENMLYKHPAIKEACVVRTPDPRVGEEVKAYVVLKTEYEGKATAEDIIEWSKKQMAAYEYPRIIEFVSELPKSASGKIMWKELEEKERTART